MHRDTDQLAFPMLVDHGFTVLSNHHNTAMTNSEIQIRNLQETLTIKCENRHDYEQWMESLNLLQEKAFCFENKNDTRFHSFAQIRYNQLGLSMEKAILLAKEEIFITDWWLSPEIMLIRPNDDETMRLDNLLGKKADDGVRIYVMISKELSFVSSRNSSHTKQALINKSKTGNIKVIRHPHHNRINNTLL
ncbi:unnamed protein product [Adineta steineri]|uniref:PH domain-containing protein n=1 Tax=Adineta steineri TaxID=433720 RepID=A0A815J7C4_9BILA|nr:unnamed protein product [Adineta steineri]CAF3952077.1 unnamed protein product [Adineta steineri]